MKIRGIYLLSVCLLFGCDNKDNASQPSAVTEVGVVTLQQQPYTLRSELTGRTTATLSAEVRPQVGGIIEKRLFTEGQDVKAGQALYQIDPSSYRAAYDEAVAAQKTAQAQMVGDCQKASRYSQLVKVDGVSKQDADDAVATCGVDKATLEEKKAAAEAARIDLNWTTVTAPISGRIGISSVTPGALVSASQDTALTTIYSLDKMYVDLTRSSADLLRLRKEALAQNSNTLEVTLTLEDGSTYPLKGRLELTEVAVDTSTGSVTLRAVFPNPQHILLPGMFVRASIDEGVVENAILAPQKGIGRDPKGEATAYVVDANNKVELRTLKTGEADGTNWVVLSGLKSGDRIVVEGSDKVTSGQTVKPVEVKLSGEAN
ncbi:efflux RND transporter periplasmic adaptor subunit [Mangrovibacter plantisponsor]|uniref:Membrane fusion protein (Multidrug efflux system) n=1 Tax=Mangrovibacter plantisponsor TaxID=451513 RepID=A0A317Q7E7_9ENTR|nr:efflux RND transporter periplasmic adaptor subunit [Mangrovibacter plantisponsor]PWW12762.1 membrane fusion protein (multidrug efflux system) [Mangrovibacter plantisponsor]